MALLITSASIQMTYADANDGNQVPVVYVQIKEAAEARQDELLYLLEQDLSPDVMTSLKAALQLMQQAEEVSEQDSQASMQYYMDALKSFRETWKNYLKSNEEASTNTLEQITDPDTPPVPETGKELESEIKENKVRLLEKFQIRIEEKYSSLYNEIEDMIDFLPEEDSERIHETFAKSQEKLGKIRDRIMSGEIDDAIEDLNSGLVSFEDGIEYLTDKNASETIKRINKMDDAVQKVKMEKEEKAKKGQSTDDEDKAIEEIGKGIKEAKEAYKSRNENSNNKNNSKNDNLSPENSDNDNSKSNDDARNNDNAPSKENSNGNDNARNNDNSRGNDNTPSNDNSNDHAKTDDNSKSNGNTPSNDNSRSSENTPSNDNSNDHAKTDDNSNSNDNARNNDNSRGNDNSPNNDNSRNNGNKK
jgi:hypothetical protein